MTRTRLALLLLLSFLRPVSSLSQTLPTTSVLSVKPLPNQQLRVCWRAVPEADLYWIEGSEGVEPTVLRNTDAGTICHEVNTYGIASCDRVVVVVSAGTSGQSPWTFGQRSPEFHFIKSDMFPSGNGMLADDFLFAAPICSPKDQYPILEASTTTAPWNARLTDTSSPGHAAPRFRLNVNCAEPPPETRQNLKYYEIYESILKPDGSTAARTTKSESCPDGLLLSGAWGERSTVTVAAIYDEPGDERLGHSLCTSPVNLTYGSSLVTPARLKMPAVGRPKTITVEGVVGSEKDAGEVLLYVNPAAGYATGRASQVIRTFSTSSEGRRFSAPVDLQPGLNRIVAIRTRTAKGRKIHSEPAQILVHWSPDTPPPPVLDEIPPYSFDDQLYVTGKTGPQTRLKLRLEKQDQKVVETELDSCRTGEFGTQLSFPDLPRGAYRITASAHGGQPSEASTALIHVKELHIQPAISLENGTGPFLVRGPYAEIYGDISPVLANGSEYQMIVTLNDGPLPVFVHQDNTFVVVASPLKKGSNRLSLAVLFPATGQRSPTLDIEIFSNVRGTPQHVDLEAAQKSFATARQLMASSQYAQAAAEASRLIEINPRSSSAFVLRSALQIKLEDNAEAFADATRAIELDPRNWQAYTYRTNEWIDRQNWDEAIADVNRTMELTRSFPMAYENRSTARRMKGDNDGAIADATRAIAFDPTQAYSYALRAAALYEKGDLNGSLADSSKARELDPDGSLGLWIRAHALSRLKRHDEAISDFGLLIVRDSGSAPEYYNSRGWAAYKKGDFEQTISDATRSIELKPTPFAHGTRGWGRFARGDVTGALADLATAAELNPSYSAIMLDQGLAHYIRGEFAHAVDLWEKGLVTFPDERVAVEPLLAKARERLARKGKR